MATKYFTGAAVAVAQVTTAQVTADDAATTYDITINGVTVSTAGSGTGVNDTATAIHASLTGSTHPYFTAITWTVATDTITGTASVAGIPFTLTTADTGGTGTIGAATEATASAGPNDLTSVDNWSDGALPANDDTIVFADISTNVYWNLGGLTATGLILKILQNFTGQIGLPFDSFTIAGAGTTSTQKALEYREQYLKADFAEIEIGQHFGSIAATGSTRLKIHNDRPSGSTTRILNSHSTGETGKPAIRMLNDNSSGNFFIKSAPGGFGIGIDAPDETSNVNDIIVSDTTQTSKVSIGPGVTFNGSTGTFEQAGGVNVVQAAATFPDVTCKGGILTLSGKFSVTTITLNGGVLNQNNVPSSGNAIGTANVSGGTLNGQKTSENRTWGTVNLSGSGAVKADDHITITTLNEPTSGQYTLTAS